MLTLIIIIFGVSLILYALLGGADFGAGIVETFAGRREERTISRAMAPVWEANHVWLILAVVILFILGETTIEWERLMYKKYSQRSMILTATLGVLVFIVAVAEGHSLTRTFLSSVPSIIMLVIAVILCPFIWHFLNKKKNKTLYL